MFPEKGTQGNCTGLWEQPRYRPSMSAFGVLLGEWIERRGFTYRSLAKAIGGGVSSLNQIKSGKRSPPIEMLPLLCETLRIEGQAKERFIALAHIAHMPVEVQERWVAWWEEHLALKAQYQGLERRVADALDDEPPAP